MDINMLLIHSADVKYLSCDMLRSMLDSKKPVQWPLRKPAENIQRHFSTSESQTSQSVNTHSVPKNSELKKLL